MKVRKPFTRPADIEKKLRKAERLEWISIGVLLSIVVVMYLSMGSSQAMRTAWIEDVLSLVAPISFLVAARIERKKPNPDFPYGHFRADMLAFLVAAAALTLIGLYTLYDALSGLIRQEHPTIGLITLFGWQIWMGWVMIAALTYSVVPIIILGRMKLPLARELHEKVLYTDADTNKADWMTGIAAMFGVLGIGLGWWWADGVAASLIALNIVYDGISNLHSSFADLLDRRPMTIEKDRPDPAVDAVRESLAKLPWVRAVDLRVHEEGETFRGEAFIVPFEPYLTLDQIQEAEHAALNSNWRLAELTITGVPSLDADDDSDDSK